MHNEAAMKIMTETTIMTEMTNTTETTNTTVTDAPASTPRIVFMGTADFGVPALAALHETFGVRAVVTIPDVAVGRGRSVQPSAVKNAAMDLGIDTILQPASLRDPGFIAQMEELAPEIICVIAFRIVPRAVYTLATRGAFNVHGSLLPKYRGAAPIHHAIMNGETMSGVTSFLLNDVVDTGTLLCSSAQEIHDGMTTGELYAALMPHAADVAVQTVRMLMKDPVVTHAQDESLATLAPKVWREQSSVEWNAPAVAVRQFILGLSPMPCAWTMMDGERVKVYRASLAHHAPAMDAGEWRMADGAWLVGCADGAVKLDEVQLPGKPPMKAEDFLRGWRGERSGRFTRA